MALEGEYIVLIVLVSVLVLLLLVFLILVCVFLRKRRALCFRDRSDDEKPFVLPDKTLQERYKKKRKEAPAKGKGGKKAKGKHLRLGESPALRRPRGDPFAHNYLENPMLDGEEMNMDWSNPVFDAERSRNRDAAVCIQSWFRMVRVRIPFIQLRNATILCQALYRGRSARKLLPQWKREKQQKDQQKKKHAGWKKKGTLSALKFYEVKGYGFAEVEQLYGLETMRSAADQLKNLYGGKGKMRLRLFISVKGIKLFDHNTMAHFATVKISSVSFCTLDPKNKKIFAFINRKKRRNFCHVFQCNEHDAQKMVETMAEAFEVTFKQLEQKREQRMMERSRDARRAKLARVKKDEFHRQSQELDLEVASMIEMAETASAKQVLADVHGSAGQEGSGEEDSLLSSREKLLSHRPTKESRLLVAQAATSYAKADASDVDSDTKEEMSQDLESHGKRSTLESKHRRKQKRNASNTSTL